MDITIRNELEALMNGLNEAQAAALDPAAKLMLVALTHQAKKIRDEIEAMPQRIVERLCSVFVPKIKIDAMPACCLVQPSVKVRRDALPHVIAEGTYFSFRIDARLSLSYHPVCRTMILPYERSCTLTPGRITTPHGISVIDEGKKGQIWYGMEINADMETLTDVSFLIRGCGALRPRRIVAGGGEKDLSFVFGDNLAEIPLMEPFDSQQMNPSMISLIAALKENIHKSDDCLVHINDTVIDRDIFKSRQYPKVFSEFLESSQLDCLEIPYMWILFDFGPDCNLSDDIEIVPNVVPVVNLSLCSVTLSQSSPIHKLVKDDNSYFFTTVETSVASRRQGFDAANDEYLIRDFDSSSYNPELLHKDIRNLYNRFIDDYHAFVDYYGLKDGETIRSLRELINRIGKSVQSREIKNRYDEGVYVMRNVARAGSVASVKVSYLTTNGRLGNSPQSGDRMENRKDAGLSKDVLVVTSAAGGENKASADQLYEMLRYHTMTADRLYTRMDIDAFLRLELLAEFGKDEIKRISYRISVEGASGADMLRRGLYIIIKCKDKKNYDKAVGHSLSRKLCRRIEERSCLSMPVIVQFLSEE